MAVDTHLALNRIVCPTLGIEAFLGLAASAGFGAVELRNDLPGRGITDGHSPAEVRRMLERLGLSVLTINALQKFNLPERLERSRKDLQQLVETANALSCPAVVLCPNNDAADGRDQEARRADTVECLRALRPLFERSGLLGYVEPLGFAESSLSSLVVGVEVMRAAGSADDGCYRLVWDTFHHYLGPDEPKVLEGSVQVGSIGLVHVSGIEAEAPPTGYRDEHRVLVSPADRMGSREQVARLRMAGYRGPVSFEPFSPAVQSLDPHALEVALKGSIEYLKAAL